MTPGETFLAAQQGLLEALREGVGSDALERATARLEAAFDGYRASPASGADELERLRSMGALLERALRERRGDVGRELGRTRLALDLVRRRSAGARPGRKLDLSG